MMRPSYSIRHINPIFCENWLVGFWCHTLIIKSVVLLTLTGCCICNPLSNQIPLGELCYPVGLGDFKLFPLLPARGLHSHATTVASRSRVGSFVGDWKCCLILPSLIYCREWNILFHVVNVRRGSPGFTSIKVEVVLLIFIALKNLSTLSGFESSVQWQACYH
jgi:hypothetical protein